MIPSSKSNFEQMYDVVCRGSYPDKDNVTLSDATRMSAEMYAMEYCERSKVFPIAAFVVKHPAELGMINGEWRVAKEAILQEFINDGSTVER